MRHFYFSPISLVFLFSLTVNFSTAQTPKLDSLINKLKTQKEDTLKALLLEKIAKQYTLINDPKTASEYAKSGLALSKKLNFKNGEYLNCFTLGKAAIMTSDYKSALSHFDVILRGGKKRNPILYASALSATGTVYIKKADYPKAMDFLLKSLSIKEELKDTAGIISTRANLGNLHAKMKEPKKAILEYRKCALLATLSGNQKDLVNSYINIGNVSVFLNKMDSSNYYLEKALIIAEARNDDQAIAIILGNLSLNYLDMKLYDKAEKSLKLVIELNEKIGNLEFVANSYAALSDAYYYQKKYDLATANAEKSITMSKELGIPTTYMDALEMLYKIKKATGDDKKALIYYEKMIYLRDSITNDENKKEITKKELQFEFNKKEALLNAEKEKESALANKEKRIQKIILYSVSAGFFLLLILAGVIFRNLRRNKKQNMIIVEQKHIVEEKQKEILDSIHYAKLIQHALLASDSLLNENLNADSEENYFVLFKPKDIVSGDFYWATKKESNDSFYLAVADSTGHGVPGAFMSLLNISFLNEAINEKNILAPNKVFNHVRQRLIENMEDRQDGMDSILVRLKKQNENLEIEYAAANNAPLIIKRTTNEIIKLPVDKMPVGKGTKQDDFKSHTITLQKGDTIYLYTDGYADQFGGRDGKKFKYKQLQELLVSISILPMQEQAKILNTKIEEWKGDLDQIDDICIIGIRA
ncbi:MAG: protein serine/threonine phosphatase [Bacteroidetes bacterium]|jgi:serine phosphatase RsbU (regulator of sigma subunit)|nr:protein serine/threonine phosphatase [Bacteroidota bacterium]